MNIIRNIVNGLETENLIILAFLENFHRLAQGSISINNDYVYTMTNRVGNRLFKSTP